MTKLIAICGSIVAGLWALVLLFMRGKDAGKKEIIAEQTEKQNEILNNAAKIRADTLNDNIDTVRERLRKRTKNR